MHVGIETIFDVDDTDDYIEVIFRPHTRQIKAEADCENARCVKTWKGSDFR